MNLESYIQAIQLHLLDTHNRIFPWFKQSDAIKHYKPQDGGWSVAEILEHISLTSHFLIILIDKATDKALRNVHDINLEEVLSSSEFNLGRLEAIGRHKSFDWIRPEHMEPTGIKSDYEIIDIMVNQVNHCLNQLNKLKHGEGLLYNTTMTVHDLGKLNVYEYIYFLSNHAARHITQMEENKNEYLSLNA